jgi:NAD(P)-dependent dehydrogenase (short-subunit alcohol dehydrogenase family)
VTKREFVEKTALITGSASGIGRETAFCFAERGATLELLDVDAEGLLRTALLCRGLGSTVHTHVVDVSDAEAMARVASDVHKRVPAVDYLINNAGVGVAGSFMGTDLATWDWAFAINVKGVVHGCHYFIPNMIARERGGHVVNVASAAGLAAPKITPVYASTKFAVVGLSESLRAELRPHGIGVTTLCPGVINTPITRNTRTSGHLSTRTGFNAQVERLYQLRGYSPQKVAEHVVSAVNKGGGVLPVSPEAWLMYLGKRVAPRVVEAFLSVEV